MRNPLRRRWIVQERISDRTTGHLVSTTVVGRHWTQLLADISAIGLESRMATHNRIGVGPKIVYLVIKE